MPAACPPPALWGAFAGLVLAVMACDLTFMQRRGRPVTLRAAALFSAAVVLLAGGLALGIWASLGRERALQFVAGYVVEEALSVDNLFVFLLIFQRFGIDRAQAHRVLSWGILGALAMRAGVIGAGAALVEHFHWLFYVFGAFLLFTGAKLLLRPGADEDAGEGALTRLFRRLVPTTQALHGTRFWVREGGRLRATPLLLVLLVVEASDILFAVDSIPAILAITTDTFVVYTSNIFAILGLRSLFFLLEGIMHRVAYLKPALGIVLLFIGGKMLLDDVWHVPTAVSLGVIFACLAGSGVASLVRRS